MLKEEEEQEQEQEEETKKKTLKKLIFTIKLVSNLSKLCKHVKLFYLKTAGICPSKKLQLLN